VDLARVAAMLPNTLQIREGVAISSGQAQFAVESQPLNEGHRWSGSLKVSDLAARDGQQDFRWDQPVSIRAAVRQDTDWTLESLTCESDFLRVTAAGDRRELTSQVDFDLARLAAELGRFVEIEDRELGGRGSLRAEWRPTQDGPLRASVNGSINGLRFVDSESRLWHEPTVQLTANILFRLPEFFSASPATTGSAHAPSASEFEPFRLERGSEVTLTTIQDRVFLRLDGPLEWPRAGKDTEPCPGELQIEGNLAGWARRLSPWHDLEPWRVEGTGKLATQFELGRDAVAAESLNVVLTNLQVVGPGWRIMEPQVTLDTSGRYNIAKREAIVGDTTLVGSGASLRARDTSISWADEDRLPRVHTETVFRAALERIDAWRIGTDGRPVPIRPAGMVTGKIRLAGQPGGIATELNATAENLVVYEYVNSVVGRQSGYRPFWQEPTLELVSKATYDASDDQWVIEQAAVRSKGLAAAVEGTIQDMTGQLESDVRGTIEYDLADIGPAIAAYLGIDMTMGGREQATFELIGPLRPAIAPATPAAPAARMVNTDSSTGTAGEHWSQRLRGHAAAGWESIHLFGLPIGPGRIDAQLKSGLVTLAPLNVTVGSAGRLTASARASLVHPREILIPRGPVLTNVAVTPEVSDKFLKYLNPLLAEATQSEGQFSLSTDEGRIPLGDPAAASLSGQLNLQTVRVRPGRLAVEWIALARQIEAIIKDGQPPQLAARAERDWLTIDDQFIDFRVFDRRVYHENLEFSIGELQVRSRGSVGFDETLALELEIPVKEEWIARRERLAVFRGRPIRVTVTGTFEKPDFGQILADLGRQVLEGALDRELNRALDRLFRPRE
jgi:hypothetical protein